MGIATEPLLHQQREAVHATAHVGDARWRSTPGRPMGPGSSPVQHVEDAGERCGIHAGIDDDASGPCPARSPSGPKPSTSACGRRVPMWPPAQAQPLPARRPALPLLSTGSPRRRAARSAAASARSVAARRGRHQTWPLQALQHDAELLVLRPTPTTTGLNDLKALNAPRTVRMAVHTHCSQRLATHPTRRPLA